MKTLMLAAAFAAALVSSAFVGTAIAQNNPPTAESNSGDPGGADKLKSISDPKVMAGFYSDSAMTKMRSPEEVKEAWARLNIEDQTAVKNQCKGPDLTANMQELCAAVQM